jgi:hypothetical protein
MVETLGGAIVGFRHEMTAYPKPEDDDKKMPK